jgi:hypothetical protein
MPRMSMPLVKKLVNAGVKMGVAQFGLLMSSMEAAARPMRSSEKRTAR